MFMVMAVTSWEILFICGIGEVVIQRNLYYDVYFFIFPMMYWIYLWHTYISTNISSISSLFL